MPLEFLGDRTTFLRLVVGGVLALGGTLAMAQEDVVVETRDIERFLAARNSILSSQADPIAVWTEYFDDGSIGLRDMFRLRVKSVSQFADAVERFPAAYEALEAFDSRRDTAFEDVERVYRRFREFYPPVALPSVYFLVSGMTTAGTVSDNGLLIGTDAVVYAFGSLDALVPVVAHELVHYQQPNATRTNPHASVGGDASTLLGQAINEGAADYLGELVSGRHMNPLAHAYGLQHEGELWCEFEEVMLGRELLPWMGGRLDVGAWSTRPRDLGYFIGYRIVESYFQKHGHTPAAIGRVLNIADAREFLEESGYAIPGDRNCAYDPDGRGIVQDYSSLRHFVVTDRGLVGATLTPPPRHRRYERGDVYFGLAIDRLKRSQSRMHRR